MARAVRPTAARGADERRARGQYDRRPSGGRPVATGASIMVGPCYGRIVHDGDRTEAGRWPQVRQARRARGVLAIREAERRDRHSVGQLIDVIGLMGTVSRPRGSRRAWLREVPLHEVSIGSWVTGTTHAGAAADVSYAPTSAPMTPRGPGQAGELRAGPGGRSAGRRPRPRVRHPRSSPWASCADGPSRRKRRSRRLTATVPGRGHGRAAGSVEVAVDAGAVRPHVFYAVGGASVGGFLGVVEEESVLRG